jgi:hypothetical protein
VAKVATKRASYGIPSQLGRVLSSRSLFYIYGAAPFGSATSVTSANATNTCSVHYVTVPLPVNLSPATNVRAAFQIAPTFHYKLQPDNVFDYPAHVRYILQNLTSEFYRWFSAPRFRLEGGSADLSVLLRLDQWISVFGKRGDYNESARARFYLWHCNISAMLGSCPPSGPPSPNRWPGGAKNSR